ncbi:pilus assembly protein [Corallococcus sp. AB049A]|uniref:Pilus assembly protein n=1 Tax=Corallococcus interemptor TaxID=2316720 RepID=A0A3A8QHZ7_9BACT|nr:MULTISPECIES: pilus assembly protein [Corallococcus]RKH46417.1 pilus assembly protein [Corallococcus sp. AB050B]RKH68326.1 pilus assembly protein [Corallococcus interemptor]RKI69949.1 pilus assembly protein [Corallococcus sp. AB049A]
MKLPRLSRGQTLVLFTLTLLLMTLLVCLTLSLGSKVKEKMETQAVADAVAYSQAAQTARVFNEMALMSRAQIGHMVSQAAVNSLINWSSYYRSQVGAAVVAYQMASAPYWARVPCCAPHSGCSAFCGCSLAAIAAINTSVLRLMSYDAMLAAQWEALEAPAARRSMLLGRAAQLMFLDGQTLEYTRFMLEMQRERVAGRIVEDAQRGSPFNGEISSNSNTAIDEVYLGLGAVIPDIFSQHHVFAAIGSRGHSFVTMRNLYPTADAAVTTGIQTRAITPPDVFVSEVGFGAGYWSEMPDHASFGSSDWAAYADDHGFATVTFNRGRPPCQPTSGGTMISASLLRATDVMDSTDIHAWLPSATSGLGMDMEPAQTRHDMGRCTRLGIGRCPSVWPMFMDYNGLHLMDKGDIWGQPKNYAVIQRDYAQRAAAGGDPWDLLFRFRFNPSNSGTVFDNRGVHLGPMFGGMDISRQTSVSTGVTYYHRRDHWKEPPNLLNPYWRATLATDDVDGEDMTDALNDSSVGWAADAYNALKAQGYRGMP